MRLSTLALSGTVLLLAAQARAQALPDLLKGRWTADPAGTCRSAFTPDLADDVLRRTDAAGHVDTQQVVERRPTGVAVRTTAASEGTPHPRLRVGAVWVYEVLGPGRIVLTEGGTGRSAELRLCHAPLPANTSPQRLTETIYARYAASDESGLSLAREANLHAFFVADVADMVVAFASHTGRFADDCCPDDPFIPGAFGDRNVGQVGVTVAPAPPDADHTTATVSFRNAGKPVTVTIMLQRTQAGWRIADVRSAPGHPFRVVVVACTAAPK